MTVRDAVFVAWVAVMSAVMLAWGIFWVIHRWGNYEE